jgi:hypothetical protein
MPYTFDFVDPAGRIDHFDMVFCRDDDDAQRTARRALSHSSTAASVMIWEEARRVAEIMRPTSQPSATRLEFRRPRP